MSSGATGGRTACTTRVWDTGRLEQTDTPRTTTKAQKTTWCKRMLTLPAQPRPNNAVDPAARRALALSSTRPTPELSGAAGKPSHGAQCTTRVRLSVGLGGRYGRGSWGCMALALFFFPHSAQYAEYRYCALRMRLTALQTHFACLPENNCHFGIILLYFHTFY